MNRLQGSLLVSITKIQKKSDLKERHFIFSSTSRNLVSELSGSSWWTLRKDETYWKERLLILWWQGVKLPETRKSSQNTIPRNIIHPTRPGRSNNSLVSYDEITLNSGIRLYLFCAKEIVWSGEVSFTFAFQEPYRRKEMMLTGCPLPSPPALWHA